MKVSYGNADFCFDFEIFLARASLTAEPTRPFTTYYKREPEADRAASPAEHPPEADRVASTAKLQPEANVATSPAELQPGLQDSLPSPDPARS